MKINFKKLGNRIKIKRKEKGLTQNELEVLANISYGYMSQIETGIKHPSLQFLLNIANILDTTIDELLGIEIKKNVNLIINSEISEIFKDCTTKEKEALVDTLSYLKGKFREI